jgi:hypothetical protein
MEKKKKKMEKEQGKKKRKLCKMYFCSVQLCLSGDYDQILFASTAPPPLFFPRPSPISFLLSPVSLFPIDVALIEGRYDAANFSRSITSGGGHLSRGSGQI